VNKSTGSGYPAINADDIKDIPIRILKPHLISQYKLDDDFVFSNLASFKDALDISNTQKLQEETTKQMMSIAKDNKTYKTNIYINICFICFIILLTEHLYKMLWYDIGFITNWFGTI
jgi:hypothetical protein